PSSLVNRDNPDCVFVTFQTQFMFVFQFAAERNLPRQPLDQPINAEAIFHTSGMQQFDQMQDVRQSTFAVPPVEQTRSYLLANEQLSHHLHETLIPPPHVVI